MGPVEEQPCFCVRAAPGSYFDRLREMAALLLKAEASSTLSPSTKQRAEEQILPLVYVFGEESF